MRKLPLVTAAILAASVSAASAQGRSYKDYEPAPPRWSGLYVGVQGGVAWTDWNLSNAISTPGVGPFAAPGFPLGSFNDSGVVGGLHVGANYQTGGFVLGIEADINWADAESSRDFVAVGIAPGLPFKLTNSLEHYGTLRGRLGVTWEGLHLYGTGGFAWGTSKVNVTSSGQFNGPFATSDSSSHTGWTAGVGAEYFIAPNVIVGVEYKHIDLGREKYTLDFPAGVVNTSADLTIDEVTARLKYKF